MIIIRSITIFCLSLFLGPVPAIASPKLDSDSSLSSAGYYQLHWANQHAGSFVLEEAKKPDFTDARILYQGPDTATLVSGRKNGTYFYRVRGEDAGNDWSNSVQVKVVHHPLSRALLFFSLGALVFLATLTMVIRGNLTHKPSSD
ncbi:MAG: fibronectin type III domain-containing protein [Acidiferrobacterales bacterium]